MHALPHALDAYLTLLPVYCRIRLETPLSSLPTHVSTFVIIHANGTMQHGSWSASRGSHLTYAHGSRTNLRVVIALLSVSAVKSIVPKLVLLTVCTTRLAQAGDPKRRCTFLIHPLYRSIGYSSRRTIILRCMMHVVRPPAWVHLTVTVATAI